MLASLRQCLDSSIGHIHTPPDLNRVQVLALLRKFHNADVSHACAAEIETSQTRAVIRKCHGGRVGDVATLVEIERGEIRVCHCEEDDGCVGDLTTPTESHVDELRALACECHNCMISHHRAVGDINGCHVARHARQSQDSDIHGILELVRFLNV